MKQHPEPVPGPVRAAAASSGGEPRGPAVHARRTLHQTLQRLGRDGWIAAGLLALAVSFNLVGLRPEVAIQVPALNDTVLHLLVLGRTVVALLSGQNPTDPWMGNVPALGYPLFHYYQHLPYLPTAALYLLLAILSRGAVSQAAVLSWTGYVLLSFFPLSIYWSMRRFGFSRLQAAFGGLASCLISTNSLYGLEYGSYVWRGSGMYTQLWGMFLLPLALAQSYVTLREGRGYFWTVLLLAATILSHVVSGYVALGSLVLLALLAAWEKRGAQPGGPIWHTLARLLLLLLLIASVISYFWIPFLRDGAYMNRSVWERQEKYDSYGAGWVLTNLATGQLLDYGRLPALTLLVVAGAVICLWRARREPLYRVPLALVLLWLLLYFGRPTWGALLNLLPMSRDLHLHRLIMGFHLGGMLLIGVSLAASWGWALSRRDARYLAVPVVVTVLLLLPVYRERAACLELNRQWMASSAAAYATEEGDLAALADAIAAGGPGRVYAGLPATWGKDYRVGNVPVYALLTRAGFDTVGYLYQALSLNADFQVLFQDGLQEQYNLFNIRYVLTPTGWSVPSFYQALGDFGRHRLYEIPTTGYFDLVGSDLAFAGDKSELYPAAVAWLNSGLVAAKQHPTVYLGGVPTGRTVAPLSTAPQTLAQRPAAADPVRGRILSESVEPSTYAADVEVTRESLLMLKATYHPNWHAIVDGVETPTVMLMPSYVGIKMAPGTHQVRLEYRAGALRSILMAIGLLTLALVAAGEHGLLGPLRGLAKRVPRLRAPGWVRVSGRLRTVLGIYLLCFAVYLMSGTGHFSSTDQVSVYLTTQSLVERGDLAIKPLNDTAKGPDGRHYGIYGVAQSVASIPLYLVGRAAENAASPALKAYWSGANLGDWGGTVPIYFVSLFNQFITPLICVLVFLFGLQLGFSPRRSLFVTLVFAFGTAAWVYAREYFQHPLESLALLAAVYALFAAQDRPRPRDALLAGLAMGLGMLTRTNLLLTVPLLFAYLLFLVRRTRERALPYLAAFCVPIGVAFLLWMAVNHAKFGSYLAFNPVVAAKGFSTPVWLGLYGYLLSAGRSIFLYSPPLLLAPFAIRRLWGVRRPEALLFAAIAGVHLLIYSTYAIWHGGWSWGPRYLFATLPFLILPLGCLLTSRRWAVALAALAILGAGVQILGVAVNYSYVYWDWLRMSLTPEDAYLWVPEISAIPMHLRALLAGRHIDLWLVWVYQNLGVAVLLSTLAVPLLLLASSLVLLARDVAGQGPLPLDLSESIVKA